MGVRARQRHRRGYGRVYARFYIDLIRRIGEEDFKRLCTPGVRRALEGVLNIRHMSHAKPPQ